MLVPEKSILRQKRFDELVGAAYEALTTDGVAETLGPELHAAQLQVNQLLTPAQVKHRVVSLSPTERKLGKIPLALLDEDEAERFYVHPSMSAQFHPLQTDVQRSFEVGRLSKIAWPTLLSGVLLSAQLRQEYSNRFIASAIPSDGYHMNEDIFYVTKVTMTPVYSKKHQTLIRLGTWPSIITRMKADEDPQINSFGLIHEQQHLIQFLFGYDVSSPFKQEDEQCVDEMLMGEVEAFGVTGAIAKAIGGEHFSERFHEALFTSIQHLPPGRTDFERFPRPIAKEKIQLLVDEYACYARVYDSQAYQEQLPGTQGSNAKHKTLKNIHGFLQTAAALL